MADAGDVRFRRYRIAVGGAEVVIDWDDPSGGSAPVPFRVWTREDPMALGRLTSRTATVSEEVGWRRAPEAETPPADGGDTPEARATGDGDPR